MNRVSTIRCAIYTRKSSEEGLEQEFNSLDAQYEACAAYIQSQLHEGWQLLPHRFDDGGVSGGTLDRPALHRLLRMIEGGEIDLVVVYKIDRLTRSLIDFAKLVERLDASGCSFVSVTQAFNTSTSMGRLTLNVLLSFAQFEREVTAERIRDKIAASKRRGLWMGGFVPLGYDRHPDPLARTLIVNPAEAECVTTIFRLYLQHRCLRDVELACQALGLRSKARADGCRRRGNGPLSRGQIHFILTNPVYRGMVRHKAETFPAAHPAIVDADLWNAVQAALQGRAQRGRNAAKASPPSPLRGKLRDADGQPMTPSFTAKGKRRYRYYVSNSLQTGSAEHGQRLPALALEHTILTALRDHLTTLRAGQPVSDTVVTTNLYDLLDHATVSPTQITLTLNPAALATALAPARVPAGGLELTLPLGGPQNGPADQARAAAATQTLQRSLALAHGWLADLRAGKSMSAIAQAGGHAESYIRTRLPMAFLSPKIQMAILAGTQPADLTAETFARAKIPLDWTEQERLFGF